MASIQELHIRVFVNSLWEETNSWLLMCSCVITICLLIEFRNFVGSLAFTEKVKKKINAL